MTPLSTSSRAFSTFSSLTRRFDEDPTGSRGAWACAAAGAILVGGVGSSAWNSAQCEQQQQQQQQQAQDLPYRFEKRRVTKGIRDPMTSYEVYAKKREGITDDGDEKMHIPAKVQATSSVDVSPMAGVENPMTASERDLEEATRKAKQHSGGLKLFSGNGNMALALDISRHLGINIGKATVGRFADGEVNVVIHENVRGKDVYVVQPTSPPVNDNIMELLLMVSTLRRASARRITVVIPYYGYARQDRKMQVRAVVGP